MSDTPARYRLHRVRLLPWYLRPIGYVEFASEWVADRLREWAFLQVLEHLGKLSVVVGVTLWVSECPDRETQARLNAWRTIVEAEGSATEASGGRIEALEFLARKGVDLARVELRGAYLPDVNLRGAVLRYADFRFADLNNADFTRADLERADFTNANLFCANLSSADLLLAFLDSAHLVGANLSGADLGGVDLGGAGLNQANLTHAKLGGADFSKTNVSQEQINSADGDPYTKLPDGITRPAHWTTPKQ